MCMWTWRKKWLPSWWIISFNERDLDELEQLLNLPKPLIIIHRKPMVNTTSFMTYIRGLFQFIFVIFVGDFSPFLVRMTMLTNALFSKNYFCTKMLGLETVLESKTKYLLFNFVESVNGFLSYCCKEGKF